MVSRTILIARSRSSGGYRCCDARFDGGGFDAGMGYILPKNEASTKPRAIQLFIAPLSGTVAKTVANRDIESEIRSIILPVARRGRPKRSLILTSEERNTLQRWARRRTVGPLALRSRMVLASADGHANNMVAEQFGVSPQTAGKLRARFIRRRLDGLTDEPRPGAPRKVTDDIAAGVIARTLEVRPQNAARCSTRSMARATGLSQSAIARIWQAHGLRLRGRGAYKPVIEMVGQIVRLPSKRERHFSRPGR